MFKLAKFIIGSVFMVTFGYFLFFVPLGSYTMYQHLRNISNTDEAKDLGDGLKQKATLVTADVVENVPEFKAVDEKVEAVKTAVSSKTKQISSKYDDKPAPQEVVASETGASTQKKSSEVSSDDRAALDKLLKSKLK